MALGWNRTPTRYLVYTIGTLIVAPETLNVTAALAGLMAILIFVLIISILIDRTNKKMKSEYSLKKKA